MEEKSPVYGFIREAGNIINSGQSQSLVITGNVNDLFYYGTDMYSGNYVPLVDILSGKWNIPSWIIIVYETNGLIRIISKDGLEKLRNAWSVFHSGIDENERAIRLAAAKTEEARKKLQSIGGDLDRRLEEAATNPTIALQLLNRLCLCSRSSVGGKKVLDENLIIIIESADMLIPQGEDIARLSDVDRKRISIFNDWFSDPGFANGSDAVVLISESRSSLNQKIAKLPQVLEVSIPSPDADQRNHFINWFEQNLKGDKKLKCWSRDMLVELTAALSIHAMNQLLRGAVHEKRELTAADVVAKVEEFIKAELGADVVEFKRPEHTLSDVMGFSGLKRFITEELIPRIQKGGKGAIPAITVCGPNGVGKTYVWEGAATILGVVVLVLKNLRSKWFGDTDLITERLRRILKALGRAFISVDEADVAFGGVGEEVHETERRLSGKLLEMVSDPSLRGRITWLFMTARVHQLSPDLRRRTSLIIPMLDPVDKDLEEFLTWMVKPALDHEPTEDDLRRLREATSGFYASIFADVRGDLAYRSEGGRMNMDSVLAVISDFIPPPIQMARRYQELQALVNCTRRRLLPNPKVTEGEREKWAAEIRQLELQGIKGTR